MAENKKFLDGNGLKKVKEDYEKKIAVKADASSLADYLKKAEIDTELDGYVKDEDLTGQLEGYVQDSELTEQLTGYVQDSELTTELAPYLKSEEASTTYVKSEGFDDKVKTAVGSVYRPKGSKENLEAIKAVETPAEGDVYNATDTGANYVYVGEGQGEDESGWDKLSETIDLSSYETTASVAEKLAQKADSTTVTEGLAAKADKTELPEALSDADIEAVLNPVD